MTNPVGHNAGKTFLYVFNNAIQTNRAVIRPTLHQQRPLHDCSDLIGSVFDYFTSSAFFMSCIVHDCRVSAKTAPKMMLRLNLRRAYSSATANTVECSLMRNLVTRVTTLNLSRPSSKNALGRVMLSQLSACIQELQTCKETRVLVLRSTVPGVFCAGADLKERLTMSKEQVPVFVSQLRSTFSALSKLPMPTIAAVDGAALGGGLELALCCDMRVAGGKAVLGLPETKLAIIPGAGGTQRLPRLIGSSKSMDLIYTGRRLNSQEALQLGLVNRQTTVDGGAYEVAMQLAEEIAENGPIALRMAKQAITRGMQVDLISAMLVEEQCYSQVIPTSDRLEGLAAFKEKRIPKYRGE